MVKSQFKLIKYKFWLTKSQFSIVKDQSVIIKSQFEILKADYRLGKNHFFVNSEILGIQFWRKKCVNYDRFEIAKKQHKSNILTGTT